MSPSAWHFIPQNRAWFWATVQRRLIVLLVHRAALRGRTRGKLWHSLKATLFSMSSWSEVLPLAGKSVVLATSIWPLSLGVCGEANICLHKQALVHHSFLPGHIKHSQKPHWEAAEHEAAYSARSASVNYKPYIQASGENIAVRQYHRLGRNNTRMHQFPQIKAKIFPTPKIGHMQKSWS